MASYPKAKAKGKAKAHAAPLDLENRVGAATEDPRWAGWPCMGNHTAIEDCSRFSNQYGELRECARCALQIQYTPRVGHVGFYRSKRAPPQVVETAQRTLRASPEACTNTKMKAKIRELVEANKQRARPTRAEARATGQEPPPEPRRPRGATRPPPPEEEEEEDESEELLEDPEACYICGVADVMQCRMCLRPTCEARHLRSGLCPSCRKDQKSKPPKAVSSVPIHTLPPTMAPRPSQAPSAAPSEAGTEGSWTLAEDLYLEVWRRMSEHLFLRQEVRDRVWTRLEGTMTDAVCT